MRSLPQLTRFFPGKSVYPLYTLLVLLLMVTACRQQIIVATPEAPTFVPTISPTPILPTNTPDPALFTPTPEPNASFGDITFSYSISVTSNLSFTVNPAESPTVDTPFWEVIPEFVQVSFTDYPHTTSAFQPLVHFYRIPDFAADPAYAQVFLSTRELLDAGPNYVPEGIPILPLSFQAQGAQVLLAHVQYLDMNNGQGVRFLTQYQTTAGLINNSRLLYIFQGISNDGLTYIAGVMPVASPILPDDAQVIPADIDAFITNLGAYRENTRLQLDAEAVNRFNPNLAALDALFKSIYIVPAPQ